MFITTIFQDNVCYLFSIHILKYIFGSNIHVPYKNEILPTLYINKIIIPAICNQQKKYHQQSLWTWKYRKKKHWSPEVNTDLHFNLNQCYYSTQQKLRTLKYQEYRYYFKGNWYGVVNYLYQIQKNINSNINPYHTWGKSKDSGGSTPWESLLMYC